MTQNDKIIECVCNFKNYNYFRKKNDVLKQETQDVLFN